MTSLPYSLPPVRSILTVAILLWLAAGAAAEDYLLGPMDKLRIRVVEWQSAEATAREWSSVSGEYVVGPSGTLSLPFVGEIPAAGRTTSDVAATIGDELQQTLGLLNRPDAAVELAELRPVFIAGDVQTLLKQNPLPGAAYFQLAQAYWHLGRHDETVVSSPKPCSDDEQRSQ
jgi:protein involved in polysaccharide export with SLBB domain